jgi:hypothetical protein
MSSSKRNPVSLDGELFESFKALAMKQRRTTISVIREALEDWMSTVGAARMEAPDTSLTLRNLITFPVPAATDAPPVTIAAPTAPLELVTPPTTHEV